MLQLFGYWRSSASFRVRLVLQLKGLGYRQHPVNLRQVSRKKAYRRVNPQGWCLFLIDGDVQLLGQSRWPSWSTSTRPIRPTPDAPPPRGKARCGR